MRPRCLRSKKCGLKMRVFLRKSVLNNSVDPRAELDLVGLISASGCRIMDYNKGYHGYQNIYQIIYFAQFCFQLKKYFLIGKPIIPLHIYAGMRPLENPHSECGLN